MVMMELIVPEELEELVLMEAMVEMEVIIFQLLLLLTYYQLLEILIQILVP